MQETGASLEEGLRLADALEDEVTQLVAGNLLMLGAIQTHLEAGRIDQARRFMEEVRETQRHILEGLRRLVARLTGGDPLSP